MSVGERYWTINLKIQIARSAKDDLKESRTLKNNTQQQMSKILPEEQVTEYKKIQDEKRSRLKKYFKK